mgnify:CR=1 FL=1
MAYRIETWQSGCRSWVPFTHEPFTEKDAAESHRLEVLTEYGGNPDFIRVVEYESEADRRARLIVAWREVFPPFRHWLDRERESILLSMVASDDLERAVGLASSAREPTAEEYEAARA